MKKRIISVLLVLLSLLFVSCTADFEYGSDKFYLECIATGGQNSTWYYFRKKIDADIVMEPLSENSSDGYELFGQETFFGFFNFSIGNKESTPYISVAYCNYSLGRKDPLNVYFNYTIKSTGERKEEVWELDFTQRPYEDKR